MQCKRQINKSKLTPIRRASCEGRARACSTLSLNDGCFTRKVLAALLASSYLRDIGAVLVLHTHARPSPPNPPLPCEYAGERGSNQDARVEACRVMMPGATRSSSTVRERPWVLTGERGPGGGGARPEPVALSLNGDYFTRKVLASNQGMVLTSACADAQG